MPPTYCAGDCCNRRLSRGDKTRDANGDLICLKCYQRERQRSQKVREQEAKVEAAVQEANALAAAALEKEKDLDKTLQVLPSFLLQPPPSLFVPGVSRHCRFGKDRSYWGGGS